MNINPKAVRILCFGDSNTWGYIPATGERRPLNERWTGMLQKSLGNNYEIIEEGLNSRTTDLDDPKHKGKNGLAYIFPCLASHYPLDTIVLMLGTNDLKYRFQRDPERIADGVQSLINEIKESVIEAEEKVPKIILMCPPIVDETVDGVSNKDKYEGAEAKSKLLPELYKKLAEENSLEYVNLQDYVQPSKADGYHMDIESHQIIAKILEEKVTKLFN